MYEEDHRGPYGLLCGPSLGNFAKINMCEMTLFLIHRWMVVEIREMKLQF